MTRTTIFGNGAKCDRSGAGAPTTAPISGKVGLWSKADSNVFFDDYTVTPAK